MRCNPRGGVKSDYALLCAAIFQPDDLIEIRAIRTSSNQVDSRWVLAKSVGEIDPWLTERNQAGFNLYFGVNPRAVSNQRGDKNVAVARCLFVDWDGGITHEAALARVAEAGLPPPSLLVNSGHGTHGYWLLREPLSDMRAWRNHQMDLIRVLATDRCVKNPERVMRLPGFTNWKPPPALCRLVPVQVDLRYALAEVRPKAQNVGPSTAEPQEGTAEDLLSKAITVAKPGTRNAVGFELACQLRDFGMPKAQAESFVRRYAAQVQQGDAPYLESEALASLRQAYSRPGRARVESSPTCAAGNHPVCAVDTPLLTARIFLETHYQMRGQRTLIFFQEGFFVWDNGKYSPLSNQALESAIYNYLDQAKTPSGHAFKPNRRKVAEVVHALQAATFIDDHRPAPFWRDDETNQPDPSQLIVYRNAIVDVATGKVLSPTPNLICFCSLDLDYCPAKNKKPRRWIRFLIEICDGDREKIRLIQEFFGYCLVTDMNQQKLLLIIGPPRAGKGIIAHILTACVGVGNTVTTTLSHLTDSFGLEPLVGKTLAIISDARFSNSRDSAVANERLLSIVGGDRISVNRKYQSMIVLQPTVRFVIISNELPHLHDSSGALASRFLLLHLQKSYLGRENPLLLKQLQAEVPKVVTWAMTGLHRLRKRGRFCEPASSSDIRTEAENLSSPISQFVKEECAVGPHESCLLANLYSRFTIWSERQGFRYTVPQATFARDLRAVVPNIRVAHPRNGTQRCASYSGIGIGVKYGVPMEIPPNPPPSIR
jgi:putative DNA primase/helicase